LFNDGTCKRPNTISHRTWVSMNRRGFLEHGRKRFGVGVRDITGINRPKALLNLERPDKRHLHRDLLIEQHANEERERVATQESISRGVIGEIQTHVSSVATSHSQYDRCYEARVRADWRSWRDPRGARRPKLDRAHARASGHTNRCADPHRIPAHSAVSTQIC